MVCEDGVSSYMALKGTNGARVNESLYKNADASLFLENA